MNTGNESVFSEGLQFQLNSSDPSNLSLKTNSILPNLDTELLPEALHLDAPPFPLNSDRKIDLFAARLINTVPINFLPFNLDDRTLLNHNTDAPIVGQLQPDDSLLNSGAEFTLGTKATTSKHEIFFVDAGVKDYQTLLANVAPTAKVFFLKDNQDGIQQISVVLKQQQDISTIHIISHGNQAGLNLGSTSLTHSNLEQYANQIQEWRSALTDTADILLYGCDLAASEDGKALIQQLSQFSGADIAASDDLTGAANLGGDWQLEYSSGAIESTAINSNYEEVLSSLTMQELYDAWQTNSLSDLSSVTLTLDDSSVLNGSLTIATNDTNTLKLSGINLNSFIGTGLSTSDTSDDQGLSITDIGLDLTLNADSTYSYTLSGQAALHNITGLTLSASDVTVTGTEAGTTASLTDFQLGIGGNARLAGETLSYRARNGQIVLDGKDLYAFVGYGAETTDTNDDIGLEVNSTDLNLELNSDDTYNYAFSNGSLNVRGIDGLTVDAHQVDVSGNQNQVSLNTGTFAVGLGNTVWASGDGLSFNTQQTQTGKEVSFGFKHSNLLAGYGIDTNDTQDDVGIAVQNADLTLSLNADATYTYNLTNASAELRGIDGVTLAAGSVSATGDQTHIALTVNDAAIDINDVINLSAASLTVQVTDTGTGTNVKITGTELSAFAGYGAETEATTDDIGLAISHADLNLQVNADRTYSYDLSNAAVDVRGIPTVTLSADAINVSGDYTGKDFQVSLNNAVLSVENSIQLSGTSLKFISAGTGSDRTVTFEGMGLSAFAGYGIATPDVSDDVGLAINNANLVLQLNADNTYHYSLDDAAVEVRGISGLTLSAAAVSADGDANNTRISLYNATLGLGNLLNLSGEFVEFKVENAGAKSKISLNGSGLSAFAGYGAATIDLGDDVGFAISNADLNLLLNPGNTYHYDLNNADIAVRGISGLTVTAEDVHLTGDQENNISLGTAAFALTLGDAIGVSGDALSFSIQDGQPTTLNATNVSALVGYGATTATASDDLGLAIGNANFSITLNADQTYEYDFNNANATLVGIGGLSLFVSQVNVIGNQDTVEVATGDFQLGLNGVGYIGGTGLAFDPSDNLTDPLRIAATGINAFIGAGSETADPADDSGIQLTDGNLGLVLYNGATPSYALIAKGSGELVGVDGLSLEGALAVRINRTGQTVDESMVLGDGSSFDVIFGVGQENQLRVEGHIDANAAGSIAFGGNFSMELFSEQTPGAVKLTSTLNDTSFTLAEQQVPIGEAFYQQLLKTLAAEKTRLEAENSKLDSISATVSGFAFNEDFVDLMQDQLKFQTAHGFTTGQKVVYHAGNGNAAIGELVDGKSYYVVAVDAQTLQLAATNGGTAVDLTSASSGTHHLSQVIDFGASNQIHVDVQQELINFDVAHGLINGSQVRYESGGNLPIGGLKNGQDYFVEVVNSTAIKLKNLVTGAVVDLTSDSQGEHFFRPILLSASGTGSNGGVNTAADTIVFATPHNLQTGDQIQYYRPYRGQAVGGTLDTLLTKQDVYPYTVQVVSPTAIKLLKNGTPLDLTSAGSGFQVMTLIQEASGDRSHLTFQTASTIQFVNSTTLKLNYAHGLTTEQTVTLQLDPGAAYPKSPIAGLNAITYSTQPKVYDATHNNIYYVKVAANGNLQFAATAADLANNNFITLQAPSGKAGSKFRLMPTWSFDSVSLPAMTEQLGNAVGFTAQNRIQVDVAANKILLPATVDLKVGETVQYQADGTAIGGLQNGTTYYVVSNLNGAIQLAATAGGVAIDLTSDGGTGHHSFIQGEVDFLANNDIAQQRRDAAVALQERLSRDLGVQVTLTAGDATEAVSAGDRGVQFRNISVTYDEEQKDVTKLLAGITNGYAFMGTGFETTEELGVKISNVDLGLALYKTIDYAKPASEQGSMTYALVGGGAGSLVGVPDISLNGVLGVQLNRTGAIISETITTPGGEIQLQFDDPSDVTRVSGTANLNIAGAVALSGSVGIEQTVSTVEGITTTQFLLGATDVTAFVGDAYGTDDELGIQFTDGTLGLIVQRVNGATPTSTYALEASGTVALVGIDGVTLIGSASLAMNRMGTAVTQTIATPTGEVRLTLGAEEGRISPTISGSLELGIDGALTLSGDFGIEKTAEAFRLGAINVNAFMGANNTGLQVNDASLGMVVYSTDRTYALEASGTAALKGISDVTLTGTANLELNRTGRAVAETITTAGGPINLNYLDTEGTITRATGSLEMNLAGFAQLSGEFGFERNGNLLRVGARDVSAFVGANGTGVQITDADLGLLLYTDSKTYALEASGTAALVGINDVTLTGSAALEINRTGQTIDELIAMPGDDIRVVIDTADDITRLTGLAHLNVGSFVDVNGSFALEKTTTTNGNLTNTQLLLGLDNVNAFVGIGLGTPNDSTDDVGLSLSDGSFKFNLDQSTKLYNYNLEGTVAVKEIDFLNLSRTAIATGDNNSVNVQLNDLNLAISDYVKLSGDFNFAVSSDNGTQIIDLGASGASAFFGVNNGIKDIGLSLSDVAGNLQIRKPQNGSEFMAYSIGGNVAVKGIDALTLGGKVSAQYNQAAFDITLGGKTLKGGINQITGQGIELGVTGLPGLNSAIKGDIAVQLQQDGKMLAAIQNVSASISLASATIGQSVDGSSGQTELLAGNIENGTLGLVLLTDGQYALTGSASASLTLGGALKVGGDLGINVVNINEAVINQTNPFSINQTIASGNQTINVEFANVTADLFELSTSNLSIDLILTDPIKSALKSATGALDNVKKSLLPEYKDGKVVGGSASVLSYEIPLANTTLDKILGVSAYLSLGESIDEYLALDNPNVPDDQTLLGLIGYLKKDWLPTLPLYEGLDFKYNETAKTLTLTYKSDATYKTGLDFNLGAEAKKFGLEVSGDATLDLEVNAGIDFALNLGWGNGVTTDFTLNKLNFNAAAKVDDLVLGAYFGPLEASLGSYDIGKEKGTVSLKVGGNLTYTDHDNNPATAKQFNFTATDKGTISAELPFYAALAGKDLAAGATPKVFLDGAVFGTDSAGKLVPGNFTFKTENFDKLLNFRNFGVVDVLMTFKNIVEWAESYRESEIMDVAVPFVDLSLGDALDFASAINDNALSKIDFYKPQVNLLTGKNGVAAVNKGVAQKLTDSSKTFDASYLGKYITLDGVGIYKITAVNGSSLDLTETADDQALLFKTAANPDFNNLNYTIHEKRELIRSYQELIVAVNKSGILPFNVPLEYDPIQNTFRIPFAFKQNLPVFNNIGLDFGFNLGDLSLSSDAKAALNASVNGRIDLLIDFDDIKKDASGNPLKDTSGNTVTGIGLYLDNVGLKGEVNLDVTDLKVAAKLGFLGLTAGGAGTGSAVYVGAAVATGLNGRQSLNDLLDAAVLKDKFYFNLTGDAYARLKGLEVDAGFGGIEISPDVELGVYLPNLLKPSGLQTFTQPLGSPFNLKSQLNTGALKNEGVIVVLPDVSELLSLKNLSFADIIRGIRAGISFLDDTLSAQPLYTTPIPVIDRSLEDTFTFLDDIAAKLQLVAENPAGALQEVEGLIEKTLGLQDDNTKAPLDQMFSLHLDGNNLNMHLGWEALFSKTFGFALDLGSLKEIAGESSAAALDAVNSLVDISSNATVLFEAIAKLNFDIGISLDSLKRGSPEIFLLDYNPATRKGTHATVGMRLESTDLNLGFKVGPINVGTKDGTVILDGDGNIATKDYAGLLVAVDQKAGTRADDGRFYIGNETFGNNFDVKLTGGFDINLPIYLDVLGFEKKLNTPLRIQTNPVYGDQGLMQVFKHLANSSTKGADQPIVMTYPDIRGEFALLGGDFSVLAILNDPSIILDGVDSALGVLEYTMDSNLAQNIPLIGDKLARGADFLRDIRQGVLADLRAKLGGKGKAIEIIQQTLWDILGPSKLNLIVDFNNDDQITIKDVQVGWYDIKGNWLEDWQLGGSLPKNVDAVQFNLKLGGTILGAGVDLPLDFKLPGFSLDVEGGFGLDMNWSFDFGFGISVSDIFYLATNKNAADKELELDINAFLDGNGNTISTPEKAEVFSAKGQLLFLQADLVDNRPNAKASGIYGELGLDIIGDDRNRLTFNRLLSSPFSNIFKVKFGIDADLSLETTMSLAGASGLPRLRGDVDVNWHWEVGQKFTSPGVNIRNLEVDLSDYVTNFLKPIADKLHDTLDPLMPIVDVLTEKVPGLDIITSDNTLKGLINLILQLKGYRPIDWSFIDAAKQIYSLSGVVAGMQPGAWLPLGDILGLGTAKPTSQQSTQALPDSFTKLEQDLNNATNKASSPNGTTKTPRSGFQVLPYLKDVSNWMKVLSGGDATLFTYEMPLLEFRNELKVLLFSYGVPDVASIDINAIVQLYAMADVGFGYDTYGIRKSIDTGNPLYALDGFYVMDWNMQGQEKPEFRFKGSIGIEGELDLFIASIGAQGLISLNVDADLQDIEKSTLTKDTEGYVTSQTWSGDGKIRGSEIYTMLTYRAGQPADPLPIHVENLFNIDGSIDFELNLVGSILGAGFRQNLLDVELYKFSYNAPKVQPVLAEVIDGVLYLNSGDRSAKRYYGDLTDGGETFTLYRKENSDEVGVEYDGYYQTFTGVTKVFARGGAGDDKFDASRLDGIAIEFYGDDGNDTLIAGNAGGYEFSGGASAIAAYSETETAEFEASLYGIAAASSGANKAIMLDGGAGNDILDASRSTGFVTLIGGFGDDSLKGGSGDDSLSGGDGDDKLSGGTGDDTLDGGDGEDTLNGDEGDDLFILDREFGRDRWEDIKGGSVYDLSSITVDLTVDISQLGITIKQSGTNNELKVAGNGSVRSLSNLKLGSGNDIITISRRSLSQDITIDAGDGDDRLFIDDVGTKTGELDNTVISGLGMGGTITYLNLEELKLQLGSNSDNFTMTTTHTGQTTLNTGEGSDNILVKTTAGLTFINTEADTDTVTIENIGANTRAYIDAGDANDLVFVQTIDGETKIDLGDQDDVIYVGDSNQMTEGIRNRLTIKGGLGADILDVTDSGDASDSIGYLTNSQINGLGMTGLIDYGTIDVLSISLGSGDDAFTVTSTHRTQTHINLGAGADNAFIEAISGATTIRAGAGQDIVNVSNQDQLLDNIAAQLTVQGGTGSDILNVIDSGDTTDNTGVLTNTQISGLGMAGQIDYGSFELLDLRLGSGQDQLTVLSTHTALTHIDLAQGDDVAIVETILGETTLRTSAGDDVVKVGTSNGLLDFIRAGLTVQGGTGTDLLSVNDSGDTTDNQGTFSNQRIVGLDMQGWIDYGTFETLDASLGKGNDAIAIINTHTANTSINTSTGDDGIRIEAISGEIILRTDAGDDAIYVGSSNQLLDLINAHLTVMGGEGTDLLSVNDSGDDRNNEGMLFESQIVGLGMNDSIEYGAVETIAVELGSGNDSFTIRANSTEQATVSTGQGNDRVIIESINAETTVRTGEGDDVIAVRNADHRLEAINASLIINGGTGSDILQLDDSGETEDSNGFLTNRLVAGLGMAQAVEYDSIEVFNIQLGTGNDDFQIASTDKGEVQLDLSVGNDHVAIDASLAAITVKLGEGDDFIEVGGTNQQLDAISGSLSIQGGQGNDLVTLNNSGNTTDNTGFLSDRFVVGLGMVEQVDYDDIESLAILLGSGRDTFTIESTHRNDTSLELDTGAGNDAVKPVAVSSATTLKLGEGDDSVILGNLEQTVNDIAASLTISGGLGRDLLQVNDSGDTTDNLISLSASNILGLGMTNPVNYGSIETIVLALGQGSDTVTVTGTAAGQTQIDTAAGNDVVRIEAIAGEVTVRTGDGDDAIEVSSTRQTLDSIQGLLVINSGRGNDLLTLNNAGDTTDNAALLAGNDLTGLGMANSITFNAVEFVNLDLGTRDDTLTVRETPSGETHINTGNGDDTVTVESVVGKTTIKTDAGNDRVEIGSPEAKVVRMLQPLTVSGGTDYDTLTIDDSGNTAGDFIYFTDAQIEGFGTSGLIDYGFFEAVNLKLGSGDDTVVVEATHIDETQIDTGDGDDVVEVVTDYGKTVVI